MALLGSVTRVVPRRRGFTLVELMVTLALVAILAAIAAPSVRQVIRQADGRSAARATAHLFREARDQAMSRGEVLFARVDNDGGTGSAGRVAVRRTDDAATSCRAAEASDADTVVVQTVEIAKHSADISIRGSSGGESQWVCLAPSGEVLGPEGSPFSSSCAGSSYRVWMAAEAPSELEKRCDPPDRVAQRDARYINNFWVVELPYNGGIRVRQ